MYLVSDEDTPVYIPDSVVGGMLDRLQARNVAVIFVG